jgi:hypothetical protein
METWRRICLSEYTINDGTNMLTLRRGQEYITGREVDGTVRVFSSWWANAPANIFGGEERHFPRDSAAAKLVALDTSNPGDCKGCERGLPVLMLDEDGTLTSVSGRSGVPGHALDDGYFPCANWQRVAPR